MEQAAVYKIVLEEMLKNDDYSYCNKFLTSVQLYIQKNNKITEKQVASIEKIRAKTVAQVRHFEIQTPTEQLRSASLGGAVILSPSPRNLAALKNMMDENMYDKHPEIFEQNAFGLYDSGEDF